MSKTHERRTLAATTAELRAETGDDGSTKIVGYAALYDSMSDPIFGMFYERLAPGAFALALKRSPDVRALFNHDPNLVLGRSKSGTLRLSNNPKGLRYEIDVADTSAGRDVVTSINRGDVDGSSFAFFNAADEWSEEIIDGRPWPVRTITDLELLDVSPVTYPAYPETAGELATRSLERYLASRSDESATLVALYRRLLDATEKI